MTKIYAVEKPGGRIVHEAPGAPALERIRPGIAWTPGTVAKALSILPKWCMHPLGYQRLNDEWEASTGSGMPIEEESFASYLARAASSREADRLLLSPSASALLQEIASRSPEEPPAQGSFPADGWLLLQEAEPLQALVESLGTRVLIDAGLPRWRAVGWRTNPETLSEDSSDVVVTLLADGRDYYDDSVAAGESEFMSDSMYGSLFPAVSTVVSVDPALQHDRSSLAGLALALIRSVPELRGRARESTVQAALPQAPAGAKGPGRKRSGNPAKQARSGPTVPVVVVDADS